MQTPYHRTSISRIALWVLVATSLAQYVLFVIDFATHPFAPGAQSALGIPFLFRWLSMLAGTFTLVIAVFIMRRVRGNVVGPLLFIYGVGSAYWSLAIPKEFSAQVVWAITFFSVYFYAIALPAGLLMFYYFPTGRVYPQWVNRWMPFVFAAMALAGLLSILGTSPAAQEGVPNPLYVVALEPMTALFGVTLTLITLGALLSILFRYHASDTRGRLQLKWLMWLLAVVAVSTFVLFGVLPPNRMETVLGAQLSALLRATIFILWQSFAAIAFGIAMLRHNLWDIDIIIRKTLTYSLVVALLLVVYFGSVIVLQQIFANVTGQRSEVITVISTLAIAALFVPLRNRIQEIIDRRFYRKKYDAQKVLSAFAETVRDETDLDKLNAELLNVVQETMQPKSVSVWLKTTERRKMNDKRGTMGEIT
jgi:hypothetical protein